LAAILTSLCRRLVSDQSSASCPSANVRYGCAPWEGGAFPVGASPTRPSLQPEATGAVMEVLKWLKPSV
jgi:hypothetical protein